MNKDSIWMKGIQKEEKKISENLKDTDILIIGGGITGLTSAYFLSDCGRNITVVDKGQIGMGISSKTTAKINYLQGTIYQDLEKYYGVKKSKLYLDSQLEAIKIIGDIVKKLGIDCDLEKVDSFLYTNDSKNIEKIDKERDLLKGWDIKVREVDSLPIPEIPLVKGIVISNTYVFHPLKYLSSLRKYLEKKIIFKEDTLVQEITLEDNGKYRIDTNQGSFYSKVVVVACHYPFFIKPGFFPFFGHLKREYVQSAKVDYPSNFTAINIDSNLQSVRFYKNYLIYGSNEQKLAKKFNYEEGDKNSKNEFMKLFKTSPEYSWMNQDLVMNDQLPWIGKLDKKQPNLYIGTGYQAWGMTNGTIAGKIISDEILGNRSPYSSLFSPLRSMKPRFLPIISNGFEYLKAYGKTYLDKNPNFYKDNVMITKIDGIDCGVYIDSDQKKHIVKNLCPHLKCKLLFNSSEKTWDCPCHGSRFSIDGDVIEGPASFSICIKNNS